MKELTTVLTVQFTYIGKFSDEEADWLLATEKERNKLWLERLKEKCSKVDDLKLLESKVFVREESHES